MEHLFIDFANSEWYDGRGRLEDRLRDRAWRTAFLERWRLARYGPVDDTSLEELVDLRRAIRSIVERLDANRRPAGRDLARLNGALAAHPVRFRMTGAGAQQELEAVPVAGSGTEVIAGEIALSAARFLTEEPERLKMCDNPGCRWVFNDETKNRSRRWCGPCGNVDKVRRFRERQRAARVGTAAGGKRDP